MGYASLLECTQERAAALEHELDREILTETPIRDGSRGQRELLLNNWINRARTMLHDLQALLGQARLVPWESLDLEETKRVLCAEIATLAEKKTTLEARVSAVAPQVPLVEEVARLQGTIIDLKTQLRSSEGRVQALREKCNSLLKLNIAGSERRAKPPDRTQSRKPSSHQIP